MQSKTRLMPIFVTMLMAAFATALFAFVPPEDSPLRQKSFSAPELYIGQAYLNEAAILARGRAADLAPLSDLGVPTSGAFLDPRSGRWGTLMPSTPMVPGVGNQLNWRSTLGHAPADSDDIADAAWTAYHSWLGQNASTLGVDLSELGLQRVTVHRGGELVQIHVPRIKNDLRVEGSFLTAVINNGNLVLWGAVKWGTIDVPSTPNVTAADALSLARNHVGVAGQDLTWRKPELKIVPVSVGHDPREIAVGTGYSYRLVWSWWAESPNDTGEWEALVDARAGNLLAFADRSHYVIDPSEVTGVSSTREVEGGVYPVSNDGVAPDGINQTYPMPFAFITTPGGTLTTDTGGNLPVCVDGEISTELDGPFVTFTDNCGQLSESTTGTVLDLGTSGGTDCATPGGASPGNTHASRSGFYEINRSMEIGRSYLPDNTWLASPLPVEMNINLTCNATGGPGGLRFYQSGGGCNNTGEIAGVFVHEWGHGMDGADAAPFISTPGEGIADIWAALRLNTSCIGRNFTANPCSGFGDPCTECTGVRDIDWAKRQSGNPHGIAFTDATCGSGGTTPCGGSTHCEGAIYAESVWDFWKRDLPAAPTNLDAQTAYLLTTRLTFEGSGPVGAWFNCVDGAGTGDGCNADGGFLNYLAADDDDGDLNNGTPHMSALFAAFDRHDIACPTPANQNSGCANRPTAAPVVTTTPLDRGARLTWTAVPNATAYRIYRTEGVFGCDFGKEYLGETTDLEWNDSNLRNGFEYSYTVVAVGSSSVCLGPASACASVTPASGANASLDPTSVQVAISSGDGDVFVDSCENATATFNMTNIGTGALTNARVANVTSPSHPAIDSTITGLDVFAASIAECSSAQASFNFTALDVSFNETIVFNVEITSDELAPLTRSYTVEVANVESDFQTFASKLFEFETAEEGWVVESGTFDRSTAVGGAAGSATAFNSSTLLNGQCDRIRSPVIIPSATSTLVMWTSYEIEDFSGGQWWDRANVATIDESGNRVVIDPTSGRQYDTTTPDDYGACNTGEDGWAGTGVGSAWAFTSWDAAALDAASLAGQQVQFQVTYGTEGAAVERGFAFDRVLLTDVDLQVEDTQANCTDLSIFSDAFETGDTSEWTAVFP